jgi:hypothetical protein
MSNLLSQASLVMIPSGYKEDIVYSAVPTDGSGDLSFTRASNGTRINSAGLVEVVPWNLCEYSEELNIWTTSRASVTTNATTAPNGTTTADKVITDSTANTTHQIYIGPFTTPNLPFVISVYAKKSEYDYIHLGKDTSTTKTWFDLTNGTVGTQGSDVLSASIESVGNGWYRCINVINNTSTSSYVELGPASQDGTRIISGTPSGGIFAWGAQLNIGSTAKPYFPTTDRLNVPRLTYQNGGGGCPSLLLEKQSTNLVQYSEQFDNAWWTKGNGSVTANATTSPDGTTNADKFAEDSTNNNHYFGDDTTSATSGQLVTFTIFAKASERSWIALRLYNGSGSVIGWYNIGSGALGTIGGGGIASITSMGNGWYRCALTITMASSSVFLPYVFTSTGDTILTYTGTSGSGVFVWGAQAEISSYPTSYIPTTSASATRVLDECSKTGISSLIGQTEGVLFVDFVFTAYDGSAKWIAFLGGGANYIGLYANSSTNIIGEVSNTTSQFSGAYSFSVGQRYKIAIAYKSNDFAYYINGAQISTASSGTVPTTSDFTFLYSTTNDRIGGKVYNQLCLFKTRLTNAELASLTTL